MEAFSEYPHIANSHADKFLSKCRSVVPADAQWVMTEKIHGCNFSFHTDGTRVRVARRSAFLGDNARVIIKVKSKNFREVTKDVGKEAREQVASLPIANPAAYVNEARLRTVLSKRLDQKFAHRGHVFELVGPLLADVMEELIRETPLVAALPAGELRALKNELAGAIKALLTTHADALIADTF
jgi:hypothetical protein